MTDKNKPFVVGLTGPTGSGKSTVASLFEQSGYKVIDADVLARKVVEKGSPTLTELCKKFGDDILFADGTLNRKRLSQIAFSTNDKTELLNSITHPAIVKLAKALTKKLCDSGSNKIIYDAPLLFESGSDSICDVVVSVIAQRKDRIDRIKLRDNLTDADARLRVNAQKPDSYYTQKSDYVIQNNSTADDLVKRTKAVISDIDEVYDVTAI